MASIKMSNWTESIQRLTWVEWFVIALIKAYLWIVIPFFVVPLYVNDGMAFSLMFVSFFVNLLLQLPISSLKNYNFAAGRFPIMLAIVYYSGSYHQKPQHNQRIATRKTQGSGL